LCSSEQPAPPTQAETPLSDSTLSLDEAATIATILLHIYEISITEFPNFGGLPSRADAKFRRKTAEALSTSAD
jgi:hypothetical protein